MSRLPIKTLHRGHGVPFTPTPAERPQKPSQTPRQPQVLRAALRVDPSHTTSTDMIIRLGRLTPGYFRLLQRQVAGEVQTQPQDRAVNQIAMMLAIMGLSLSYYSAKQMTEKVHAQPAP
ncbi:putative transmembrane protein ZNF593OS [Plectropomus leopardus]|uniref:putative transmembrane protein ZNF593OS n=1 Tax=Plectropomus leopardus TaxID=160734 RepID=UPI001C4BBB16|nr:putative transmembrane protein ZNF593OS [Plectropomus leopardus]